MKRVLFFLLMILTIRFFAADAAPKEMINYPATKKINHTDTYFGTTIEDPYQWLENDTSAETEAWVKLQNKVTHDYLEKIPYRADLKERYSQLYDFPKLSEPAYGGDYIFYTKSEGLKNQPLIYVQKTLTGKPLVFMDANLYDPKGLTAISLNSISLDNRYVTLSYHVAGSDWNFMKVFDIMTKKMLDDKLEGLKNSGSSWYKDGFFYSRYEKPEGSDLSAKNEYQSVYYHKVGDAQSKDKLVYKDKDNPLTYNSVSVSEDENYFFLYRASGTDGYEVYYKKANESGWDFKPLFTGFEHKSYVVDEIQDKFIVQTDIDAPNYRVISIDPVNPDKKNWVTIIPEQKSVLEKTITTGGKLITQYLENASNKLFVFDMQGKNKKEIALPGPGTINITGGKETENLVLYTYTSFTYPTTIFSYNTFTGESQLFKQSELKFKPEDYEAKQVWYKSKDGTKVSMFIVHKKGMALNKNNPTYLYAYGGFNIKQTPYFAASRILLLENGGVFAMPNLRGGGEYGEDWHKAGMLMKKQNVFDDMVAAAEYLIKKKYTSKDKIAIGGGSNGGLLVGACMTQHPDLFKVAIPEVGVMDMLKFHKFTVGWGWVPEYGSSEQSKEMFMYLKGYSPYHNLKPGTKYPATLITTGDHDDRVVPAHSFKFAARLQEYNDKTNPTLIRIETNAGHGSGKPTSKIIDEQADKWSFFFWNLGVKTLQQSASPKP
ncbi:MAG: serine protease, family peptidase [Bacteroidota bacterium]|nr:serine protease, family peptidase [Bacteroidota bacterium]